MTKLMKRYCKENSCCHTTISAYGLTMQTPAYVAWLEAKVLDGKTIEKFQKIIRNQCDEISALKAQLTWRPVSDPPEGFNWYWCEFEEERKLPACRFFYNGKFYTDHTLFYESEPVTHWLPIPPAGEGEC